MIEFRSINDTIKVEEDNLFIQTTYDYVMTHFPNKYNYSNIHQIYDLRTIIQEILYLLKTGTSYNNYRGPIKAKALSTHVIFFANNDIFIHVYKILYDRYDNLTKHKVYNKHLSIDTSIIPNRNGKEGLGRTPLYKNKKCYKISNIVDSNKVSKLPIIVSGNTHDSKIAIQQVSQLKHKIDQIQLLGDGGYDSNKLRCVCDKLNVKLITNKNKRNTKDPKKIHKLTKKDKYKLKKRVIVENFYASYKQYRRVAFILDSYRSTYVSFSLMAMSHMLSRII